MTERWLQTPEVVRWWGNPDHELALLAEDLDQPRMDQWIVEFEGVPFCLCSVVPRAFLAAKASGAPSCSQSASLTLLSGVPEVLGKGHGSRFLRKLAGDAGWARRRHSWQSILTSTIFRARRAYAQELDLKRRRIVQAAEGPVALMIFRP